MDVILIAVISLGGIGAIGGLVLYIVAQKFKVFEDPRIAEVEDILPAANCGGCGYPGCKGFAEACVKATSLDALFCPVGGSKVMSSVADILGLAPVAADPKIAVIRWGGTCEKRPRHNAYNGAESCAVASSLYGGETGCSFGCLGLGDCVRVCAFDALVINPQTRLPEVDEEKCTACGACVKACPKLIIEIRKKGPKSRRIFVSCVNKDKGGVAKKACVVACIGCSKCQKVCAFSAITIENNLAFIDSNVCRLCRKCVPECPTGSIVELNFPVRKVAEEIGNN